jgi:hypothetical protein
MVLLRPKLRWFLYTACSLAVLAPATRAQVAELRGQFARLVAEGEREQIPWTVSLSAPELRLDQRLGVEVKVSLSQSDLKRHATKHDLVLMVRVAQQGTGWLPGFEWLALPVDEPLASGTGIEFQVFFLARPGNFRVGIVLLDRISGHSSVTVRPLRVDPLRNDPLPHAFRSLPAAEFVSSVEGFEAAFLSKMTGKLWLPVETRRKVQMEILANFTLSEEFRLRQRNPPAFARFRRRSRPPSVEDNLLATLAALKPLTEFASPDGLRITGLDLNRRRVVFEQEPLAPPAWQRLQRGVADFKSNVVSADTLLGQKESAEFLREILRERLRNEPAPGGGSASDAEKPLRVLILLSGAMVFPKGADLSPLAPAPSCHCRVYFIRLRLFGNFWDELDSILRPLKPRRFDVSTPADYRRALAAILEDLRKL